MNAVGRLGSYISRGVYTVSGPFHPFGGCVDIIVVEQPDGTFKSSPWYVRFGKFQGVLKTREQVVTICVNGSEPLPFHMYLDNKGEAYFLREVDDVAPEEHGPPGMLSSFSSSSEEAEEPPAVPRSQSCSSEVAGPVRTNSRRARILGLVFGRRSEPSPGGSDAEIICRADSLERAELAADLLELKWSTNLAAKKTVATAAKDNGPGVHQSTEGPVPAVLQICPRKESDDGNEEVSEPVQSFVYCESSESSVVMRDSSTEQTREAVFISGAETGEVRVCSEVVRARTEPQSEDTVVEHLVEDYKLEVPRNESLTNVVETCIETDNTSLVLGSSDELVSLDECVDSSLLQSEVEVNAEIDVPKIDANRPPPVDLEEEQLLFGDIEEFNIGTNEALEKSPGIVEDSNMSVDKNDRSDLSPENLFDENFSSTAENFRVSSNPIVITGANKVVVVDQTVGRFTESLPNIWSKRDDSFGSDDLNCLSHSLDSSPKIPNLALETKADNPNSIQLEEYKAQPLISELLDTNNAEDKKLKPDDLQSTPVIEISLCKHLFYEGMGFEAASRAFDAEKLSFEEFSSLGSEITKNDRLVVRIDGSYYTWDSAGPLVLGMVSFGAANMLDLKGKISVDQVEKTLSVDQTLNPNLSPGGNWKLWPFSFSRSRSRKEMQISVPSDIGKSDREIGSEVSVEAAEDKNSSVGPKNAKKMVRALSPTSEQLASLNLKEGSNSVTFTFLTPMLGKQQVDCRIYLWKWNTQIVISDVDGTITRSDVLGQFMPLVGVDWSHLGVAHLFSAIKENGYQMLFLSARAISQAYITRQFLLNLKQDGKALPDGPVVISPDGLFPSLYREVIRRAPHEFKIACLEEIRSLFPSDCNPFYAGFGNRDTDEVSYLKVGIPKGKIFIINPKGEVVVNRLVDRKSYKSIHALVNGMFPSTASSEQEDFNQWNFWKLPPQIIDE